MKVGRLFLATVGVAGAVGAAGGVVADRQLEAASAAGKDSCNIPLVVKSHAIGVRLVKRSNVSSTQVFQQHLAGLSDKQKLNLAYEDATSSYKGIGTPYHAIPHYRFWSAPELCEEVLKADVNYAMQPEMPGLPSTFPNKDKEMFIGTSLKVDRAKAAQLEGKVLGRVDGYTVKLTTAGIYSGYMLLEVDAPQHHL